MAVGERGAISAALGGAASALPTFLFAVRLKSIAGKPGASYATNFFLGEFIKVLMIIGLLALITKIYADLHWPSMLVGLGLALQATLLAFWKKS